MKATTWQSSPKAVQAAATELAGKLQTLFPSTTYQAIEYGSEEVQRWQF